MSKRNKKTKIAQTKKSRRVTEKAFELKLNKASEQVTISFEYCDDNNYCLSKLNKNELKDVITTFKKLNSVSWIDAWKHNGLQIKVLKNIDPPPNISKEVKLNEIRFNQKGRLHGYHMEGVYYIIWFDKDHEVTEKA